MCAGAAWSADEERPVTVAGTVGVAVVVIAAALVIYLLIALLNPERF
ncbi:potassium-transporting ATPase subunit F [Rhodococcus hoagii]|nr:potassium-transporting ATPase subunit F [Prescottella equi]MBP0081386.1 potassium-transporting ATPase subunit F [Prescottella equi]MBP0085515.1 potassium-transporting ATPase subunit F [Prescottella equi]MBP0093488.1 potassium-transporting ATPase subunit F [Prescottella equi]MBP0097168.1 potassium-transporting ATPase subunit F [Prescottella equi]